MSEDESKEFRRRVRGAQAAQLRCKRALTRAFKVQEECNRQTQRKLEELTAICGQMKGAIGPD